MDYGDFKILVQNYLEENEDTFNENIDYFTQLGESRVYRMVRLTDGNQTTTGTLSAGAKTLTLPTGFIEPRGFWIVSSSNYQPVLFKDPSFIREVWPNPATTGTPRFYALTNATTLTMAPTPSTAFDYELDWYGVGGSLTGAGDDNTSWLSENALEVLLYAVLLEGYIYMKGSEDLIAKYGAELDKALAALKVQFEGRVVRDDYESGVPRL